MEKIRWFFLLFYVAFCRADSQLDLYCTDPDTGLRYPVNSTWPSTKFCGTYTCHAKFISVEGEYKEITTITKEYDDNKIVKGSFKDDDSDENSEANNDDQIESSTEPGEEKDFDVDENDFSDWEKDEFKKLYELYKMASDLSESIKKSESDVKQKKEQFAKNFVSSQIQKMYGKPLNQELVSNNEQIQENSHKIDKTTNYPYVLFYNHSGQMPPIPNNEMSSAIYSDYNKYLAQYYGYYPYSEYEYPQKQEQKDSESSSSSTNVVYNYPDHLHYDQQANNVANTYVQKYFEFWNNYYENLLQYNRNEAKKSNDEHHHHHAASHQHHGYNTNVNQHSYYNQYYHQQQNDDMNKIPMNDQLLQCSNKNEENSHAHDHHHHHHHHHNTQENQLNSTHEHNHQVDHKQMYSHEHNKYYSNANQNNHSNTYYYYDPVKKEYTPNEPQNFSSYMDYYKDYMAKYGSSSNVNTEIAEDNSDDAAKEYHKNYYNQYYQNSQTPKNEPQIPEVKTESFHPQSNPGIPDESKIHQPSYKYKLSTSDLTSTVEQDENWTNFRDPDDTIQWKVNPYTTDGYPSDNKENRAKDLAYSIGSRSTSPCEDNTKFNRINAKLSQFGLPSVSKSLRLAKLNPLAPSKSKVPSFGTLVKRFAPEEDRKRRSADPKTYITVQGCPEPNEPGKFSCGDNNKRFPKCCPQKILS